SIGVVLIGLALLQAVFVRPASADGESFFDGLAAYDAGDVAETIRIWTALASSGDANAQVGLAGLYRAGAGVARDPAEAARLYRLAAEQGDSDGQLNLGRLYLDGVGVEQDPAAAYAWLTLAARQGRRWAEEQRQEIEPGLSDDQRIAADLIISGAKGR
ncbi:MAG: tetratricopeptide repeat protein, partial [Methyloligellaceae bacterium]